MRRIIEKPEKFDDKLKQNNIVFDQIALARGDEEITQDTDSPLEETKQ